MRKQIPTKLDREGKERSCALSPKWQDRELSCYLLANMTEFGKSKLFNYKELENFGYNIVIYPVTTQRLAMKNVEDGLKDIFVNGHQNNIIDKMQTRKRLYELVDYEKYNSLDEKIYNFSTEGHE